MEETVKPTDNLHLESTDLSDAIRNGRFDPNKEYLSITLSRVTNKKNIQMFFKCKYLSFENMQIDMVKEVISDSLMVWNCGILKSFTVKAYEITIENCKSKNKEIKILDSEIVNITDPKKCKIHIVKSDNISLMSFNNTKFITIGQTKILGLIPYNDQFVKIPVHENIDKLVLHECHIDGDFSQYNFEEMTIHKCTFTKEFKLPKNLKIVDIDTYEGKDITRVLNDCKNSLTIIDLKNIPVNFFVNVFDNLQKLHLSKCNISKVYQLQKSPLKSLDLNHNNLIELPELPNSVQTLNLDYNFIIKADKFPSNLKKLKLNNNSLTHISNLPKTLEVLICNSNKNLQEVPSLADNIKELNVSDCNISELPKELPKGLNRLFCNNNKISKIPKLPETLTFLECDYNNIKKITNLPEKLISLHADGNLLTELPKLPDSLKGLSLSKNKIHGNISIKVEKIQNVNLSYNSIEHIEFFCDNIYTLNLEFNKLKEVPLFHNEGKNIRLLTGPKLQHNQIDTLKNFDTIPKFCHKNIEGNPIEQKIFKGIESPEFEYEEREYKNMTVSIATIPRGTVLYRGYYAERKSSILNDFIGFPIPDTTKHRVIPYMNVFFYPYPFITERIFNKQPDFETITVITKPIKMVLNILPSHNYRGEKELENSYTTSCNNIEWEGYEGKSYDPCFTKEFLRKNSDVVGNMALAFQDTEAQRCLKGKDVELNRYHRLFNDVLNTGIPEFIMYPLKERILKDVVTDSKIVTPEWMKEHINDFNYFPLYVTNTREEMKQTVDALLSPEGLKNPDATFGETLHMSIDPKTKFFIIPELAEPHILKRLVPISETDKLSLL